MKAILPRIVAAALFVAAACAWAPPASSLAAVPTRPAQQKKPISKEGMIKALGINGLSLREFIHEVETRGVTFEVTPEVERELRAAGAHPQLIAAARANYRPPSGTAARPAATPTTPAQQRKPVTKSGMIEALKINALTLQEMIGYVETLGVEFEVTPEVERELRAVGAHPQLIAAARANYRPPPGVAARPSPTPTPPTPTTPTRRGLQVAVETETPTPATPVVAGRFHALVIGNNAYEFMPRLKTAEADARSVAAVLRDQYAFDTKLLLNATRQQIISQINAYRRSLDQDANLLIYYAGHGYNDADADKGYWLPVDARLDDNANWISADDINTNIKVLPARHVLVVSDSCYSGTIYRATEPTIAAPAARGRYLDKMLRGKSRTLMASGGKEPVADGGGGGHSIFASALLRGLREAEAEAFTGSELFRDYVQESVAGRANQTPEYSPLRNSGHEGGDFVFIRRR